MRLDKYLKISRLIKRRTVANEACDAGRVLVNGKTAKASVNVKAGDVIEIQFGSKAVKVEVLDVQETVRKEEAHKLLLNNRRTGTVSGVTDVISFDIAEILLETEQGMLTIKGADLHVNRLTLEKGEVDIEGRIDSMAYSEVTDFHKAGASLLGRLFK